jgi:hypothetical protein
MKAGEEAPGKIMMLTLKKWVASLVLLNCFGYDASK